MSRDGREQRGGGKQRDVTTRLDPVRMLAADVLAAVRESDAYANLLLPRLIRERRLDTRDAAFATELTYGTCRAQGVLDQIIESASGRPVTDIDGPVLDALRLGSYQLLRTRVGAHAAVSTSVDLVRRRAGHGAVGFANAVLRKISQKDEELWVDTLAPSMADDLLGNLAFRYAHPRWIAEVFHRALNGSMGQLQAALAADDARPITHLVARPGQITADELAAITGGDTGRMSPYCVYLDGGDPGALEPVRDGVAGVQDEGSQLVARAVAMAPLDGDSTDRWLDLCAGPGGKAALLGSLAAIDGTTVDAIEPAEHRAKLIEQVTAELPVTVHIADGRSSGLEAGYDRVLVDAPCSGLGSLRRRPEARWRRGPGELPALVALQGELLSAAIELARPGGVIGYSTCSPHPDETIGVVSAAVESGAVTPIDARELIPNGTDPGEGPWVQLWPHLHGTDAMFLALLRKN